MLYNHISPIISFAKRLGENTIIVKWEFSGNAEYDIEVNGQIISNGSYKAYIHKEANKISEYTYRVRAKNDKFTSSWSTPYTISGYQDVSTAQSIHKSAIVNELAFLTTSAHSIEHGWLTTENTEVLGQVGDTTDLIKIKLNNTPTGVRIKYRAYVKGTGWQVWKYDYGEAGTAGKQLQAIQVMVVQPDEDGNEIQAEGYSIEYVLYASDLSNVDTISKNGEISGVIGKAASAFYCNLISADEFKKEVISSNTTWTTTNSPYMIEGDLIINQGVRLTINAGVQVIFKKFAYRSNGIEVHGSLIINGTSSSRVTFGYVETGSLSEDNYEYQGIVVKHTGTVTASYTTFSHKGYGFAHLINNGTLTLNQCIFNSIASGTSPLSLGIILNQGGAVSITNTTIKNNYAGITVTNNTGDATISSCSINNNIVGVSLISTLASITSRIKVLSNTFDSNNCGISIDEKIGNASSFVISSNTISNSKNQGIKLYTNSLINVTVSKNTITNTDASRKNGSGAGPIYFILDKFATGSLSNINPVTTVDKNTLTGNNIDAIALAGALNSNVTIPKGTTEYVVDGYITVPAGKQLIVDPAVRLYIRGYIYNNGVVQAEGSSDGIIIFTSVGDSKYGVTHTAASGTEASKDARFDSIIVNTGATFIGTFLDVRYGGYRYDPDWNEIVSPFIVYGTLSLTKSDVRNSLTNSIYGTANSSLKVVYSKLVSSQSNAIYTTGDLELINSDIRDNSNGLFLGGEDKETTIISNNFTGNEGFAISNYTGGTVDAAYNYWGDANGPSYRYIDGSMIRTVEHGDLVDFDVLFIPYLASAQTIDLGDDFDDYIKSLDYTTRRQMGSEDSSRTTGNFTKNYNDIESSFVGMKLAFERTYNSLLTDVGVLGKGWTFSFQGSIEDEAPESGSAQKVVKMPDGSVQSFSVNSDSTYTANDTRNTLTKNSDGSFSLKTKDKLEYRFISNKLSWIKDKNGNRVNITYDSSGKINSISDGSGRTFTLTYANDRISTVTEAYNGTKGRVIQYSYTDGKLTSVTNALGKTTSYVYDATGKLSKIMENGNILEEIEYYISGIDNEKVKTHKDKFGNINTYTYDNENYRTLVTDSNNKITEYWYDAEKFLTFTVHPDRTVSFVEYFLDNGTNKYGEMKTEVTRTGETTSYEVDEHGNITKKTNNDFSHMEYYYDSKDNLIKEVDETGNKTFFAYDSVGNVIKKIQPLDGVTEYSDSASADSFAITEYVYYTEEVSSSLGYNVKGLLKNIKDPEGYSITHTYDAHGNVLTATDQEGNVITYEYDLLGFKKKEISARDYNTEYAYDKHGHIIKTVLHGGETTRIVYDSCERIVKEVTPNLYDSALEDTTNLIYTGDHGNRYAYMPNGKIQWEKDANNNLTSYTYDLYGNVSSETKPDSSVYLYKYDDMNRLTKTSFKENAAAESIVLEEINYTLISNGVVQIGNKKYIDDTSFVESFTTYDYEDRIKELKYPDGTNEIHEYNPNGTLKKKIDFNGNASYYSYDGLNRVIDSWTPFVLENGTTKYSYVAYDYNKVGNKTKEKYGRETVLLYEFPTDFVTTEFTYYGDGNIRSQVESLGKRIDYFYDSDGFLSKMVEYASDTEFKTTEYINNYIGKPISKVDYVLLKDLAGYATDNSQSQGLTTAFTYDKNGNIFTITTPSLGADYVGFTTTFAYDNLNHEVRESKPCFDENNDITTIIETTEYNWQGNVTKETDSLNHSVQYVYNKRGLLQKIIDPKDGVFAYYYDRIGRKIAEVSPKNYDSNKTLSEMERTEYTYDIYGRVKTKVCKFYEKQFDSSTSRWSDIWVEIVEQAFKYDGNGNVIKELNALGYESGTGESVDDVIEKGYGTTYTYNLANLLTQVLTPESVQNGFTFTEKNVYDALGRKVSETDGTGVITSYTYNDADDVLTERVRKDKSSAENVLEKKTYDYLSRILTETDGEGNTTTYEYNSFDQIRKVITPSDYTVPALAVIYQYDVLGRRTYEITSTERISEYTYNNRGGLLSTKKYEMGNEADAITTSSQYDKAGNKRYDIDGNGNVTTLSYDELNRLTSSTVTLAIAKETPFTKTTTIQYDANSNEVAAIDWRNNSFQKIYDGINRLVEKRDPYATTERLVYNHNNSQTISYDALNHATTFRYDRDNRQVKTIDAVGNEMTTSYDNAGNIYWKEDGKQNRTSYEYDALKNLAKVTNAKGEITLYTYDLNGNITVQEDGKGNKTTFEYNSIGKLCKKIDGNSSSNNSETYTYTADGSVATFKDRNGINTTYQYNILDLPIIENIGGTIVTFTYDKNGNQLIVTNENGTIIRTYDENNRELSKTVENIGTINHTYDIIISRTDMSEASFAEEITDSKDNVSINVYDKAGRLKYITDGTNIEATYSYLNNGSTEKIVYSSGAREDYTYYDNNNLKSLINKNGNNIIIESFRYEYDASNNQTKKIDAKGVTNYTYDKLNRLLYVQEPSGKETSYTYDSAGNRLTETIKVDNGITSKTSYTYDSLNRLISTSAVEGSETTVVNYTYDKNGNMMLKQSDSDDGDSTSYKYDKLNRLVKATVGSNIYNYTYDGEGLRISKSTVDSSVKYLYNNNNIILELDVSGNETARNIYGVNILARETSENGKLNYLFNGHGDVTALLDSSNTVLSSYYYDAFGVLLESSGYVVNPIRYAGYQYDNETGNYYVISRMYDPVIARFLQEDTFRGNVNDPLSLNLYTYCANNPLMYNDPDGHAFKLLSNIAKKVTKVVAKAKSNVKAAVKTVAKTVQKVVKKAVTTTVINVKTSWNSLKKTVTKTYESAKKTVQEVKNSAQKVEKEVTQTLNSVKKYVDKSINQVVLGNYTDDITLLGTGLQIALGATGLDIVTDIRDISADFINWEWSKEHVLQTGLDLVGLVPVVGAIKNVDEVATLAKNSDELTNTISKVFKNSDEISSATKKSNYITKYSQTNIYRGDVDPYSMKTKKGWNKSYIDLENGNLKPASLEGIYKGRQTTVTEHGLGGFRRLAKAKSPYTSFTTDYNVANSYGNGTIELDISALRKAIQSGEVKDVAILTPKKIQKLMQNDKIQSEYWKNRALNWTIKNKEYLIKGEIPEKYFEMK